MSNSISSTNVVWNHQRKFGSALSYVLCKIDGKPALFTKKQLRIAVERASKNPEDLPKSFWEKMFG